MRDKKTRAALIQWLIPSAVLLLIVVIMLIDFSVTSKKRVAEELEEEIVSVTNGYAQRLYTELNTMTEAGLMAADLYKEYPDSSEKYLQMLAIVLGENTFAQGIVISDKKGNGITHEGKHVNISEELYFKERGDISHNYTYIDKSDIFTGNFIVSEVPIYRNGNIEKYLFLYYPIERLAGMVKKIEFDSRAFYAIVKADGEIINSVGTQSVLLEKNLLESLKQAEFYKGDYEKLELKFPKKSKGIVGINYKDESKMLAYVSLGIQNWQMVIGVNKSFVDKQENIQLFETTRIIRNLIIAIFVFFGLIIVINLVNKIRANEQSKRLENRADTDLLTELNNKIATERKIKEYLEKNPDKKGMLFVLDVDNFKKINDTMGHAFGDEVLRTLGHQIQAEFRATDIKGRVGGDEFILFLKDVDNDEAIMKQADKVAAFFRNFKAGEYVKYSATASIGVAIYYKDGKDFETLYKAADKALYRAKKRGKNQMAFYDSSYDVRRGIVESPENVQNV